MTKNRIRNRVYQRLISSENIYMAIHLAHSYIHNTELLSEEDQYLLNELQDRFNIKIIEKVLSKVKKRLTTLLKDPEDFFSATVYFKPKKFEAGCAVFRPIHTASLCDQIAMTAMLQVLVYEVDNQNHIALSELSHLLPECFYGNRVSTDGKHLFKPWQEQYHRYTERANELLLKYAQSHEQLYEVNLDLQNFFPSVDPMFLASLMEKHFPAHLNSDECATMKTIIRKLLVIMLDDLNMQERVWYSGVVKAEHNTLYVKGIPQGLPHAYFLANLVMVNIRDIYQLHFPGDMLFYVDDSVIFTNGKSGFLDDTTFDNHILEINHEISEIAHIAQHSEGDFFPQNWCYSPCDFSIKVHGRDGKSTFCLISDAAKHAGELKLRGLCRESSKIRFDIYSAFSEVDVEALYSRTKAIAVNIDREMEEATCDEAYLERLRRYKKFFEYRMRILEYRKAGNIESLLQETVTSLKKIYAERDTAVENFMHHYANETLAVLISYVHTTCMQQKVNVEELQYILGELEKLLYQGHTEHAYMQKSLSSGYSSDKVSSYDSLQKIAFRNFHSSVEIPWTVKCNKIQSILAQTTAGQSFVENLYTVLDLGKLLSWASIVRANSDCLDKMLYNAIVSEILQYDVDDGFCFAKRGRSPINYSEIRLLSWLRSKKGALTELQARFGSFCAEEYCQTADYSLIQVMDTFHVFVDDPDLIDQLIRIHKYCCDTWKNGSKFLYFYTLHNQEHAVTLIQNAVKLIHAISQLQINQMDFFILFAACYLHDISMVSMPDYDTFYNSSSVKADLIYSKCKARLLNSDSVQGKHALCDTFQDMDVFFADHIRNRHAYDSARDIRRFSELSFLDSTARELIAQVSEAHYYDTEDVYFKKSNGNQELVHKKTISIILRLSDLLDISRGRVSNVLLNHNLQDMNPVSRFHWISHLITGECALQTSYSSNKKGKLGSHLDSQAICEKITLTIDVYLSQMTGVDIKNKCKYVGKCNFTMPEVDKGIQITIDEEQQCTNANCCFLCKWFVLKNNYLLPELAALKRYLSTLPTNFYSPEIVVNIRVLESTKIPNDVFDYLREYVE